MKWKELLEIRSGKNQKTVIDPNGQYPIYGSGGIIGYATEYLCPPKTTIVGRKGTINSPIFVNESFWNVDTAFGLIPSSKLLPKYLYYFCCHFNFTALDKSTTIPSLAKRDLENIEMNVPPLDEQSRIVARIEELFSELDKAVDTLKTTKEQLAVYRQAVLKSAFEGKYTIDWRKSNDCSVDNDYLKIKKNNQIFKDTSGDENELILKIPNTWMKVRFGEIFDVEVGATPSRQHKEYWNGKIAWVSSGEVRFESINRTHEMITQHGLNNSSTNLQPIGTVLLAMIGEGKTRGQAAILNIPAAHNQNTAAILVSRTPCQPKYVYYFLQLNYENTRRVGSGNNQKALNKERVRAIRFPFAPVEEQVAIVKEIDERLSVCDSIEKTVDAALAQADAMRQSILKQAFEGKI
ncbi:restriction endonuclease subunit S [Faecalibacterium prausnitzii]|uniref:restriction endonuclease subunit S n=1 Tax=Faecalibacterium prausnitzii TaxID=853 RepID=UPI0018CC3CAA|nr:restriction endonuclease subunit S [Faecalibacterium prausnitzii]